MSGSSSDSGSRPILSAGPDHDAKQGVAARRVAWTAIRRVHEQSSWSVQAVGTALARSSLDVRDRAFAANLAYETLRWEGTLDWVLEKVVARPLREVEPRVLDVLRLGAWQLLYGAAPDQAAVSTSVDLARAVVGARATGFVNGTLRGLVRQKDRLPWPPASEDRGLGLRLGYPEWVVAEARATFGERAAEVLDAGNRSPGVTLRAARGDRDALVSELRTAGVDATAGALAPDAVRAPGADPGALPAVAEGRAVPQDEASMLVAQAVLAGRAPGRMADLCAAPGGKATQLAQAGGEVVALDRSVSRIGLVDDLAARLGVGVRTLAAEGLRPPLRPESMDAVLVDAPCTGLGVVRRRPEVRWRRSPEDPRRLAALQVGLLAAGARLVRPGGRLVYSACTWTLAETRAVRSAFLAGHGDRWSPLDVRALLGLPDGEGPDLLLDPARDGTDGMYVAAFSRA